MQGLSIQQLIIISMCAVGTIGVIAAALLDSWRWTAIFASLSFACFGVFVVFTLAAMARTLRVTRGRVRNLDRARSQTATSLKLIEQKVKEQSRAAVGVSERVAASERRTLATIETHRAVVEEELAALRRRSQSEYPPGAGAKNG